MDKEWENLINSKDLEWTDREISILRKQTEKNMEDKKKFWLVWNPNSGTHWDEYETLEKAEENASDRAAANKNEAYYVLETRTRFTAKVEPLVYPVKRTDLI